MITRIVELNRAVEGPGVRLEIVDRLALEEYRYLVQDDAERRFLERRVAGLGTPVAAGRQ